VGRLYPRAAQLTERLAGRVHGLSAQHRNRSEEHTDAAQVCAVVVGPSVARRLTIREVGLRDPDRDEVLPSL
jgi:hypothetical protein